MERLAGSESWLRVLAPAGFGLVRVPGLSKHLLGLRAPILPYNYER